MRWFRRRRLPLAAQFAGEWRCAGCDQLHVGMMALASFAPDPWPHEEVREPNAAIRLDGDFLSEDFCVLDGAHFMIRAVLEIPVHGVAEKFGSGCGGRFGEVDSETDTLATNPDASRDNVAHGQPVGRGRWRTCGRAWGRDWRARYCCSAR